MITICISENNLTNLCKQNKQNWKELFFRQEIAILLISKDDSTKWDTQNRLLRSFHQSKGGNRIKAMQQSNYKKILDSGDIKDLNNPIFILEDEKETQLITKNCGVLCFNLNNKGVEFPLFLRGWSIDTHTFSKHIKLGWDYFFQDLMVPINSLVIIDRYFFSPEGAKNYSHLNISFTNLEEIINSILKNNNIENNVCITIIFDASRFLLSTKKEVEKEEKRKINNAHIDVKKCFNDISKDSSKIVKDISKYITLELISIDNTCNNYSETHDRFIISNYFIVNASHNLRAYDDNKCSLLSQMLYFDYLYSRGIDTNSRSTPAASTQDRLLTTLKVTIENPGKNGVLLYSCNGSVTENCSINNIKNKLLKNC